MAKHLSLKQSISAELLLFSVSNLPRKAFKLLAVVSPITTLVFLVLCYKRCPYCSGHGAEFLLRCWDTLVSAFLWGTSWLIELAIKPSALNDYRKEDFYKTKRGQAILKEVMKNSEPGFSTELCENGSALSSDALNAYLISQPDIPFRVVNRPWFAYAGQNETLKQFVILNTAWEGSRVFNAPKIRLLTDLIVDEKTGGLKNVPVLVQRTDYVSSLMTDAIAFNSIHGTEYHEQHELSDGVGPFFVYSHLGKLALRSMSSNEVSNQIGVSVLGFSNDGHLAIVVQSENNVHSRGKHCPTGSGSLDWADLGDKTDGNFLNCVYNGARRELAEEAGLQKARWPHPQDKISANLLLFAFARMLHRGGKPEFFFIASIAADIAELERRRRSLKERVYTESAYGYRARRLDLNSSAPPHRQLIEICDDYIGRHGTKIPPFRRLDFSYQLEHALKLLRRVCSHKASAIMLDRFLLKK